MKIYIDCEFDALWYKGRHIQCLVSIGAVAMNEAGKEVGRFYSLICPYRFKRLTRVVKKMTQLQNEEIAKAEKFRVVIQNFLNWMDAHQDGKKRTLYSFGPDDKRTLLSHAKYERYKQTDWIEIVDLQRTLSASVLYNQRMISSTLSLDDVKSAYDVQGEVNHNALNDALDLMHCHQYMVEGKLNDSHIKAIWKRKETKRIAVEQREKMKMKQVLQERYAHNDNMQYPVSLYHMVIEQLIVLEERQHPLKMMFYNQELQYENQRYAYADIKLSLHWYMQEEPFVEICFQLTSGCIAYKVRLNYGNASILDGISRVAKNYVIPASSDKS